MATTKVFNQLGLESRPLTHCLVLKATTDLTETVAATAQEFRVVLPANSRVIDVVLDVVVPPRDASDAAFDDILISVGDSGAAGTYIPSTQIAALNGGPVKFKGMDRVAALTLGNTNSEISGLNSTAVNPTKSDFDGLLGKAEELADDLRAIAAAGVNGKTYATADYLKVVVTPESGKSLSNIDIGEIRVYVALQKTGELG